MKNMIIQKLLNCKKYLLIAPYIALCYWLWQQREKLYGLLPPLLDSRILDMILASFGFAGLIIVWETLRCPFWIQARAEKTFRRAGLKNCEGDYPVLVSAYADPCKKHGKILKLNNRGLSPVDFDEKLDRLQTGLGGVISNIEENRNCKYTLLNFLPYRYVTPTLITPRDNAFGSVEAVDLLSLLIVGRTGTGKTVATKVFLKKIIQNLPKVNFTILDFKRLDFASFAGLPGYYSYDDCVQGLEGFYAKFKAQQAIGKSEVPHYLLIDEWGAFILAQEKKLAEELKAKLGELLMLGRGFNYHVICGLQRADAEHFPHGARDQFHAVLALGNLSKEGKNMLFPDDKERMKARNKRGEGYLLVDEYDIERVKIEQIKDIEALDNSIREAILHNATDRAGGEAEREPPAP